MRGLPGVYQVPAGTVMDIDLGSGTATALRTWSPPLARRIMDEGEAVDAVHAALDRAVSARVTPGATPLVVLSGGIDSSAVAAWPTAPPGGSTRCPWAPTSPTSSPRPARSPTTSAAGTGRSPSRRPTCSSQLPYAVWASESEDPSIIEYLLPLVALYRALDGPPRRVLTGYGADIPLAGMHREDRLPDLDTAVAHDMATYDGLNEMSPVLSAVCGHWSTHPYWDRDVLDLLVSLEAGLKRRHGRDKWVLRAAMADLLPERTVSRPKLGVHEGSGTTSSFSRLLLEARGPGAIRRRRQAARGAAAVRPHRGGRRGPRRGEHRRGRRLGGRAPGTGCRVNTPTARRLPRPDGGGGGGPRDRAGRGHRTRSRIRRSVPAGTGPPSTSRRGSEPWNASTRTSRPATRRSPPSCGCRTTRTRAATTSS